MTEIPQQKLRHAVAIIARDVKLRLQPPVRKIQLERVLWLELSTCILSSQVPYELALAAANRIDAMGFLSSSESSYDHLATNLATILMQPIDFSGSARRYRFPRLRAAQLAMTKVGIKKKYGSLGSVIYGSQDVEIIRRWLVEEVHGMGPKQASMFLRNVGVSYDVAVIDRHVCRYMLLAGLCVSQPSNLGHLNGYRKHECTLRRYADDLGHAVGIVDWAIWIVMRALASMEKR